MTDKLPPATDAEFLRWLGNSPTFAASSFGARLREIADGMEWRPIATAPKDGTRILASGRNYGLPGRGRHIVITSWNDGWANEYEDDGGFPHLTHWQPLPAPPQEGE